MNENIIKVIRSIVLEELCNDNLNVLLTSVENTVTSSGINSFNDDTEFNDEHEEDHFFRVTIPKYSLIDFKKQFRISKGLFDILFQKVNNILKHETHCIPIKKKLLFTIWVLARTDSFIASAEKFALTLNSANLVFCRMIDVLYSMVSEYIKFPSQEECLEISEAFKDMSYGFPGVIGIIDACHIHIKQPSQDDHVFCSELGFHSVILQAVCDHKMKFLNISVGMEGSYDDSKVFECSSLYKHLSSSLLISPEKHMIGDAAYPLLPYLLTPFKDNGVLMPNEIIYNERLNLIRANIEQTFVLLKSRFRRLEYLDMQNIDLINKTIAVACMLHNFIIEHSPNSITDGIITNSLLFNTDMINNDGTETEPGIQKRNYILSQLG